MQVIRADRRSPAEKWLQFRRIGGDHWSTARTERVSRSRVLFTTTESVEVGDELELVLFECQQDSQFSAKRSGKVVRRILMNWPNLDILIDVRLEGETSRRSVDLAA